jgi:hypothetical protein
MSVTIFGDRTVSRAIDIGPVDLNMRDSAYLPHMRDQKPREYGLPIRVRLIILDEADVVAVTDAAGDQECTVTVGQLREFAQVHGAKVLPTTDDETEASR